MATVTTNQRQGLNSSKAVKVPCRVASTSNITLSGEQTIDGVAVVDGDRVLVTGQTDASENGIYDADTGAWTRAKDWDGVYDVVTGTATYVHSGTSNSGWHEVTTTGTITVGTTNVAIGQSIPGGSNDSNVQVQRAGTNAELTDQNTVNEKRKIIMGVDYGASLNADGVDDWHTVATNAMTDLATAGGGTLYFPEGTYLLSDGLNAVDNIVIEGDGYGSVLKCPAAGFDVTGATNKGIINVPSVSNVRITNIRFYGTKTTDINNTPKLIYLYGVVSAVCDMCMVDHCWFENSAYEGVWNGGTMAYVTNVQVSDNIFYDIGINATYGGLPAIQLNATRAVAANNVMNTVGIGVGATGEDLVVSGNCISGPTVAGVQIGDGATAERTSVTGNIITIASTADATTRSGILAGTSSTGADGFAHIAGNSIRINGTLAHTHVVGIRTTTSSAEHYLTIDNNNIEINVKGYGISLASGTTTGTSAVISNNTIRLKNEGSASANYGILCTSGSGNTLTTIQNNNKCYGFTSANSSYAYSSTPSSGTLNAYYLNNFCDGGNVAIGALNYSAGEFDNIPITMFSDLTSVGQYIQAAQVNVLNLYTKSTLTIASGAIDMTGSAASTINRRSRIDIYNEAAAGTDDLDTITGGIDGDIIIISAASSGQTVVVKDGTGNIACEGDFSMDNAEDRMMLHLDGSTWYELTRSNNGA